ncbi:DUF3089 domain-containing protein [Filobacillus milosensis]|uniref:DUF3089 domain-containing protein n=1 Tax=Filobacillus milosensis TaxID=94137 RepID=A0A4Y8IIE6_9BACI|nr:DUF3089 domain-containing protein [Filobacillus milosensis]TFB13374.1 DUF3089 domain-containing protein [Filobacillus milosensis]
MSFVELERSVFTSFGKGDFEKVHALIFKAETLYPDNLNKILFWKACVFSVEGKVHQSISALKEGINRGIWWNPNTLINYPDLKKLKEYDDFNTIINHCDTLLKEAKQQSQFKNYTFGNPESDTSLLTLHWRGSNVANFAHHWFNDDLLNNYQFSFPQSSQVHGYNSFCWDDPEIALQDTLQSYKNISPSNTVVIAGASQGGKLAIEYALKETINTKHFIAVVPAIKELDSFKEILNQNYTSNLKGWIITGDQDYFYDKTCLLNELLCEHNIQSELIIKDGLGHYFPADFSHMLSDVLKEVNIKK